MEICVDTLKSAIIAEEAGASRIELCQALTIGGLTPSIGLMRQVKATVKIPVFALIRARSGDFCFSETEVKVMEANVSALVESGADGIAIGALTKTGEVDVRTCTRLIDLAGELPVTFNRAFDLCVDPEKNLDTIIFLKCSRILTSGQASDAFKGLSVIKKLILQGHEKITIVPAGGITEKNLERILIASGVKEFHASASVTVTSQMVQCKRENGVSLGHTADVSEWKECSKYTAESLLSIARKVWQ